MLVRAIPWPSGSAVHSWRQLAGRPAQPRQLAAVTAGPELPSRRWPGLERGDGGGVRVGTEWEDERE